MPKRHILIKLAQKKEELEAAFRLLQRGQEEYGFTEKHHHLWLTKQHALPSTSTFIALEGNRIIGAVSLFGENPLQLPLEAHLNLEKLRNGSKERLAEISAYAIAPDIENKEDIAYALFHYAVCFSSIFCHHELLITRAPPALEQFYKEKLGFSPYLTAPMHGKIMTLHVLEIADHTRSICGETTAEFEFPEKKFHLVNHHVMHPQLLNYFFNQATSIFAELNDLELRSLRNIYNFGEYASVLPKRESALFFPKLPKHKRFEMRCEGYLLLPNQQKVNFEVYDVSSQGLKIQLEEDHELKPDTVYMLNISIGILKATEVIARSVWVKKNSSQVGLEIHSSDEGWQSLIHYLESDFYHEAA